VLQADSRKARLRVIGQAPGRKVHETGITWNDKSGERLREWLGLTPEIFYDAKKVAITAMAFCYPGKSKSGDLPPRPECAFLWHGKLTAHLPNIKLTLLIGSYAQKYYLGKRCKKTLTETVKAWQEYIPLGFLPLVHPSPRNLMWLRKNPWFEKELVLELRKKILELGLS
jgi:uracil-DNA glycosylase